VRETKERTANRKERKRTFGEGGSRSLVSTDWYGGLQVGKLDRGQDGICWMWRPSGSEPPSLN
jgi:hypothetical protein